MTTIELENIKKMNELQHMMTKFEQSPENPQLKAEYFTALKEEFGNE